MSLKTLGSPNSYTIAWIAALPIERAAAKAMLDEEHASPNGFSRLVLDLRQFRVFYLPFSCLGSSRERLCSRTTTLVTPQAENLAR